MSNMIHSVTGLRLVVAGRLSYLRVDTIDARFGATACSAPTGNDTVVLLTAEARGPQRQGSTILTREGGPDRPVQRTREEKG